MVILKETYAVPEPVGCGRESDTAGTNGQREDLADHDPSTRTPGAGEEEDVDADKGDHGAHGVGIVPIGNSDNGHDELADYHAQGTPQQQGSTTDLLNGPERDWGRADVDDRGDHSQQERVLDRVQLLEEGSTEVEDEVDAGPSERSQISILP